MSNKITFCKTHKLRKIISNFHQNDKNKSRPKSALVFKFKTSETHILLINVFLRDIGVFQLKLEALGIGNFNDDLTSALEHHILVGIVRA